MWRQAGIARDEHVSNPVAGPVRQTLRPADAGIQNRFQHSVRLCRWQQPVKRRRGDAREGERNRTARDAYRSLSCATRVLEAQDLSYSRIDTLSAGGSHDERGRSPTSGRTARPPRVSNQTSATDSQMKSPTVSNLISAIPAPESASFVLKSLKIPPRRPEFLTREVPVTGLGAQFPWAVEHQLSEVRPAYRQSSTC
jgi:hypothetical protein